MASGFGSEYDYLPSDREKMNECCNGTECKLNISAFKVNYNHTDQQYVFVLLCAVEHELYWKGKRLPSALFCVFRRVCILNIGSQQN